MPLASILLCALVAGVPKATAHKSTPKTRKAAKSSSKTKTKTRKAAPVKKHKGPVKAVKIRPTSKQLTSMRAMDAAKQRGTAVLAGFLLRYANGAKPANGLDTSVRNKINSLPGGRAAAKRIAGRIEGLSSQQLGRVLGSHASTIKKPPRRRDVGNAARVAKATGWTPGRSLMIPTTTLPGAYAAPTVDKYEFYLTGVACHSASDSDGNGDEVVVVTKVFHGGPQRDDQTLPTLQGLAAGEARKVGNTKLFEGGSKLLLSAVFEDDGGDSVKAREELDVLLALAETVADGTSLADIEASIEFSLGILELSNPDVVPSIKMSTISLNDVKNFYKVQPEKIGDIEWKLQDVHETDGGQYTLYYSTPQLPPPPKLDNVRLTLMKLEALEPLPPGTFLEVFFDFKDAERGLAFPIGKSSNVIAQRYQMLVQPRTDVEFAFRAYISRPGARHGWTRIKKPNGRTKRVRCGEHLHRKCPPFRRPLDISPQPGVELTAKYRASRGWIMGNVQARSGQAVSATGKSAPKGRIVFTIDHE